MKGAYRFFDYVFGALLARILGFYCILTGKANMSRVCGNLYCGANNSVLIAAKAKIDALLDLRAEHKSEELLSGVAIIEYKKIDIKEGEAPSLDKLNEAVSWIEQRVPIKTVLVQCNLGRGRAPTVVCAYLIRKSFSLEQAIVLTKRARRVMYLTSRQVAILREFAHGENRLY